MSALVSPVTAASVQVDLEDDSLYLFGGNFSQWGYIETDQSTDCALTGASAVVADDAKFGDPDERSDAFDNSLAFRVGGTVFNDADDIGRVSGQSVTTGPELTSGLRTSLTYTALPEKPVLRILLKLQNRGSTVKKRAILYDNNLGSDNQSNVRDSSDGDVVAEPRDRWIVSSDHATTPGDVVVTWSFFGKGAVATKVDDVINQPGSVPAPPATSIYEDCLSIDYQVRVPGNSTRYLLLFVRMTRTHADGSSAAADFDQEKAYLFKGLSTGVRNKVVNWTL